jgi:DNA repair protein RadC
LKVREIPEIEKPLYKLRYSGAESLSNHELLLLLTGADDTESANAILKEYEGLSSLRSATLHELEKTPGIGSAAAGRILSAMELGKRIERTPPQNAVRFGSPEDIASLFMGDMRHLKNEHFRILMLNARGAMMRSIEISVGNLCGSIVDARDVFREAIKHGAASIVLVHNHPSGDPEPSEADIHVTKELMKCGEMIGIRIMDHIVIGDGEFKSFRRCKLMEAPGRAKNQITDKVRERELER